MILNLIKTSGKSLTKNRLRSLLTSLGIIIGVSSVIVMVGIGEGSQQEIEQNIEALGTNLIMVIPGSSQTGGVRGGAGSMESLTVDDVEMIREKATYITQVSPIVRSNAQVIGGNSNWYTSIMGVSSEYLDIRDWEIEQGISFDSRDEHLRGKVALLGKTVANQLFGDRNPVGERIMIQGVPFSIKGILKEKGQSGNGQDQDDTILVPYSTAMYRLQGDVVNINMINASATSVDDMQKAAQELTSILRTSHGLVQGEEDDFTIRTQDEITEMFTASSETLTMLLGAIAGVSLLVGGIGIMNIMLVTVTERTREIGIRLSVGARESDVLVQFLAEAIVLSFTGCGIGILLSLATGQLLDQYFSIPVVIEPTIVMLSVIVSGVIGIGFGFFPARKAASLDPIEALRYE